MRIIFSMRYVHKQQVGVILHVGVVIDKMIKCRDVNISVVLIELYVLSKGIFVCLVTFLYDIYCLLVFGICAFISDVLYISMEPNARYIARKHLISYAFITRSYIWRAVVVNLKKMRKVLKQNLSWGSPQKL